MYENSRIIHTDCQADSKVIFATFPPTPLLARAEPVAKVSLSFLIAKLMTPSSPHHKWEWVNLCSDSTVNWCNLLLTHWSDETHGEEEDDAEEDVYV